MRTIPIADPDVGDAEIEAATAALESGAIADGPPVRAFEAEFAEYCGATHGVATTNGTAALHAALEACGVGDGDVVVTTPFSFVATANAIRLAGATAVFADVDPWTFDLDPDAVEAVVREREGDVDALVVVHLYGLPAEMDRFVELADEYDLTLVEDAAQAHGATYRDRRVGTFGDAASFSFYATKNLTTGEGGMILTDDDTVAERARRYVDHGQRERYDATSVGHNYRMASVPAAIGRVQLEKLPRYTERRRHNAALLDEYLADVDGVATPVRSANRTHVFHQYTVRTPHRDRLLAGLSDRGIDATVYYPTPIHRQPAYADVTGRFPHAERLADEVLSLPVHPGVTDDDVERIARAVEEVLGE